MTNVGSTDRIIRGLAGVALLVWAFIIGGWTATGLEWVAVIVGAVLLLTSLVGFCPLYRVLGMNTCGLKR